MKHISIIFQDDGMIRIGENGQEKPKLDNGVTVRSIDAAVAIVKDYAEQDFVEGFEQVIPKKAKTESKTA